MTPLIAWTLLALSAHADVVDPNADGCPRGAGNTTYHGDNWCVPWDCADDPNVCPEGMSCVEVSLCVEEVENPRYDQAPDTAYADPTTIMAYATCEDGEACAQGSCETELRCAAPESASDGCGCASGAGSFGLGLALLAGLAALGVGRRHP